MVEVLILKKRKDFVRAAKGLKVVTSTLVLQAAQSLCAPYRDISGERCFLGFTATKKIGKAHLRNRTKRRMRAAAREIFPQYGRPQTDYVIIGRFNTAESDFKTLLKDLKFAVKRINKMLTPPQEEKQDETAPHSAD